jgi:PA14 domain
MRVSYFQGPRDFVALRLLIAGSGENLRIFSTQEFKPPPNPELWGKVGERATDSSSSCAVPERVPNPAEFGAKTAAAGLTGKVYRIPQNATTLPNLNTMMPAGVVNVTSVGVPSKDLRSKFFGQHGGSVPFAINFVGNFWTDRPGPYRFVLAAEDGARLFIDDQLISDNVLPRYGPDRREASLKLCRGFHNLRLLFFHFSAVHAKLRLLVAGPGEKLREFNTDHFTSS